MDKKLWIYLASQLVMLVKSYPELDSGAFSAA
jgi:hypothetical protein